MRFLKKIIFFLLSLIILVSLSLWIVTKTVRPEWIKSYLNTQLASLTGEKSQINGDISWQLLPAPGIQVNEIEIGNAKQPQKLALHIDHLLLKLKLKPLLHGQFVFREIKLNKAMAIVRPYNENEPQATPPSNQSKKISEKQKSKTSLKFAIDDFSLNHGEIQVLYQDTTLLLSDIHIDISHFNLNEQYFPIKFRTNLKLRMPEHHAEAKLKYKGRVQLNAQNLLDLKKLSHIVSKGQLVIRGFKYDQLTIKSLTANASSKAGKLQLDPMNIAFYDGNSVGSATYNFDSQDFSLNQTATGVNTNKFISSLLDKKLVEGQMAFTLKASGNLSKPNWQKTLRAQGNLSIKDGKLLFLNSDQLVNILTDQFKTLLSLDKLKTNIIGSLSEIKPKDYQQGQTDFKLLNIGYRLFNDMRVDNSLILQTKNLELTGQGYVDINTMKVNNQLMLKVPYPSNTVSAIESMFIKGIPLKLTGSLHKPLVYPDIQQLSIMLSKNILDKTINRPINQLKNGLKDFLGN